MQNVRDITVEELLVRAGEPEFNRNVQGVAVVLHAYSSMVAKGSYATERPVPQEAVDAIVEDYRSGVALFFEKYNDRRSPQEFVEEFMGRKEESNGSATE